MWRLITKEIKGYILYKIYKNKRYILYNKIKKPIYANFQEGKRSESKDSRYVWRTLRQGGF